MWMDRCLTRAQAKLYLFVICGPFAQLLSLTFLPMSFPSPPPLPSSQPPALITVVRLEHNTSPFTSPSVSAVRFSTQAGRLILAKSRQAASPCEKTPGMYTHFTSLTEWDTNTQRHTNAEEGILRLSAPDLPVLPMPACGSLHGSPHSISAVKQSHGRHSSEERSCRKSADKRKPYTQPLFWLKQPKHNS